MAKNSYWTKNEAQKLFEEALKNSEENKVDKAIELYRKSLRIWPHNGQAHYNLGVLLATKGALQNALSSWKKAIWLNESFKLELMKAFDLFDDIENDSYHTASRYRKAA